MATWMIENKPKILNLLGSPERELLRERTIEFPNGQRETHTKCYKVSRDSLLFALCFENFQLQRREGQTSNSRLPGRDGIHFGT